MADEQTSYANHNTFEQFHKPGVEDTLNRDNKVEYNIYVANYSTIAELPDSNQVGFGDPLSLGTLFFLCRES